MVSSIALLSLLGRAHSILSPECPSHWAMFVCGVYSMLGSTYSRLFMKLQLIDEEQKILIEGVS